MSTAQFIPNFQNFAEALGSGSFVFDMIDRVNKRFFSLTRINYVFLFFHQQTKIDASNDEGDKPKNIVGDIEFDNVVFTYPARQEAPV